MIGLPPPGRWPLDQRPEPPAKPQGPLWPPRRGGRRPLWTLARRDQLVDLGEQAVLVGRTGGGQVGRRFVVVAVGAAGRGVRRGRLGLDEPVAGTAADRLGGSRGV